MKTKFLLQDYSLFCVYFTVVDSNCHVLVMSGYKKFCSWSCSCKSGYDLGLTNLVLLTSL